MALSLPLSSPFLKLPNSKARAALLKTQGSIYGIIVNLLFFFSSFYFILFISDRPRHDKYYNNDGCLQHLLPSTESE